jgi:electron transfer flavoprotein alpha subunit
MKIAVCVKQVPRLDQIRFDRANRIVREDVEAAVNPLDLRALGHAIALREQHDGEVVVLTMGPPQAREVLEETLRRGANRAVHLVDKRFAGADTLATARALARALDREKADLVLFGRSTLDGATGQVGPQVAELAGVPHLIQATEIRLENGYALVERETERGSESWKLELPAAITVERGPAPPEPELVREVNVEELMAEKLGGTPRDYGTRGSPTFVKEVRELSLGRDAEQADGAQQGADRLARLLGARKPDRQQRGGPRREGRGVPSRSIWALAERDRDGLHPISLEALGCAHSVAGELDAEVVSVLICDEPRALPDMLAAHGAERVLVVRDARLGEFTAAGYADALCAAIEARKPFAVIGPWTTQGREYVPRAAARLGLGLTGDFVALEVPDPSDEDPDLMWIKPAWASTVQAPIIAYTTPSIGTLRPGVFPIPDRNDSAVAVIEELEPRLDADGGPECAQRTVKIDHEHLLDSAPLVVCVGDEIRADAMKAASALAELLGGSVGATAAAVKRGLAAPQLEISVLKRSLAPALVIALGVLDEQPLDAVRGARTIVTVHPDRDAPAHTRADFAILADPVELVDALHARLESEPS